LCVMFIGLEENTEYVLCVCVFLLSLRMEKAKKKKERTLT